MTNSASLRIDIVYSPGAISVGDGVYDHGERLVEALNAAGCRSRHGRWAGPDTDVMLVQYTPFSWGHRGVAPDLCARLARVRIRRRRPRIALMVHEPFVVEGPALQRARGVVQRQQLRLLCALADTVLTSTQPWRQMLAAWSHVPRVTHLPVGSNLPDQRKARAGMRRELGIREGDVVMAAFDSRHPGRSRELMSVMAAAASQAGAARLLLLGAQARPLPSSPLPTDIPGPLPAERLAAHLAAADLFVAPFVDGVSTRRTTVVAALQHGLPVVGTAGHLTDLELLQPGIGMMLVPFAAVDDLVEQTAIVIRDRVVREEAGAQARELFERRFAWPVIVTALLEALGEQA